MTPLSIAYVATAAICALVALQHLVVAFRVPERRIHLLFAGAACGVAGERRWRQLLNDVQLLAARIDRYGHIVELNPHFERVLGYQIGDARGREYWSFVAPDQREERRAAFQNAMKGNSTRQVEVQTVARDGSLKHIVWRNVVLRDRDGSIEGMLSTAPTSPTSAT